MTKYIVISIGNTDNKLTQRQWRNFVFEMQTFIKARANIHFFGGSSNWELWQNVCWLVEVDPDEVSKLEKMVKNIRTRFNQDSAFFMVGDGGFV